jgi:hypothetical protein
MSHECRVKGEWLAEASDCESWAGLLYLPVPDSLYHII